MHYLFLLTLLISCSSDKKFRGKYIPSTDNDERISHDWDKDGYPETVNISPISGPGEYRELTIFRGVPEGMPKEKLFSNRSLIPKRALPGGILRLQKNTSFHLIVDASASGRIGEVITWKISWKKNRYLLTGMVRDWTDKLDPHDHKTCDVDLQTGRGKRNGKRVKFKPLTVDLIDLNEKFLPSICEF